MALLTPPDPTEEVAEPALRPRSPTAEDLHPMIYTTCRGATDGGCVPPRGVNGLHRDLVSGLVLTMP